jgi:hypothetical protein
MYGIQHFDRCLLYCEDIETLGDLIAVNLEYTNWRQQELIWKNLITRTILVTYI